MSDRTPQHMLESLEEFGLEFMGMYAQATLASIKEQLDAGQTLSLNDGSELERIYEHYCQP